MSSVEQLQLQRDSHTSSQTAVAFHQPVSNPKQSLSYQNSSCSQPSCAHAPVKAKQEPVHVEKKGGILLLASLTDFIVCMLLGHNSSFLPAVDMRSVFVRNLPTNIMNRQLENEMSRFGPLQPNKVCLKTNQV